MHLPRLLPASVRKIFPRARRASCLPGCRRRSEKHFPRARSVSGTQFEHHGVGNNSFRPRCSNRFGRDGQIQYSPHTYQPTRFFSQRSRGRRFSGVPCSASGSLACSQGQSYLSSGCAPGSNSAAFHFSGPARLPLSRQISFGQGRAGAKLPPQVPLGLPSITFSAARILRHRRPNNQSPPRDSPDGRGSLRASARGPHVLPTQPSPPPLGLPLP